MGLGAALSLSSGLERPKEKPVAEGSTAGAETGAALASAAGAVLAVPNVMVLPPNLNPLPKLGASAFLESSVVEEDEEVKSNVKPPDEVPLAVEDTSEVVALPNLKPPEDESEAPPNLKPPVESEGAPPNLKPPPLGALEESEKVPANLMPSEVAEVPLEPNLNPPELESVNVAEPSAAVLGRKNKRESWRGRCRSERGRMRDYHFQEKIFV